MMNLFLNKPEKKTINFRYVNSYSFMFSEICKIYKLKQTSIKFMP